MKKVLLVFVGMALAAGLVYAGWLFGARTKFMSEAFAVTVVDKCLTDLTKSQLMLNQIQAGKIDDVKHSLQMEIDGNIVTIDAFRDDMDARSLDLAQKIFTRIAQDRANPTNSYSGNLPKMDSAVEDRIKSILKQASQSQTNK